jgi:hypothetical protein
MVMMTTTEKAVRQTVTLPPQMARRIRALARKSRLSTNRVLVDLVQAGLEARDQERERFFELAERLAQSDDPAERKRLKAELGQMTFGD